MKKKKRNYCDEISGNAFLNKKWIFEIEMYQHFEEPHNSVN